MSGSAGLGLEASACFLPPMFCLLCAHFKLASQQDVTKLPLPELASLPLPLVRKLARKTFRNLHMLWRPWLAPSGGLETCAVTFRSWDPKPRLKKTRTRGLKLDRSKAEDSGLKADDAHVGRDVVDEAGLKLC